MKILIINDFAEKIGGVEIYCHRLKNLLEREGHNVKFWGGPSGIEGNILTWFISTSFSIKYYLRIKAEIEHFKPDIIHARSFSNISPSFLIAAKKYNIPVVVTPATSAPYALPQITLKKPYRVVSWLRAWLHREMKRRYIDFFICPSNILAEHLKNDVGIDSSKIGIVTHFIEWEQPAEAKNSYDKKDVLYAGRLSIEKGIEYLIQAMPKIKEEHPEVKLHIVGEGDLEQNLKDLATKLEIEDKVIFHGYVAHENLATIYRKSSILVLPSVCKELFGLTIIEAMSQGTPVITTNIGGQAELVENGVNGLLVNPGDAGDLAEKICITLDDKELARKMGEKGIKIIKSEHTPEKHLRRLIEIYESVR